MPQGEFRTSRNTVSIYKTRPGSLHQSKYPTKSSFIHFFQPLHTLFHRTKTSSLSLIFILKPPNSNVSHHHHLQVFNMAFSEFKPLDDKSLVEYIKATPSLSSKLKDHLNNLTIKEVGDGNLNFVFIVVGSHGSFVIKQVMVSLLLGCSWFLLFDQMTCWVQQVWGFDFWG